MAEKYPLILKNGQVMEIPIGDSIYENNPAWFGERGVIGQLGVSNPPYATNTINYITIATTGNASDFGDLTYIAVICGSCSNSSRGLFAGGYITGTPATYYNEINYVTIATTGNASDFGDLTEKAHGKTGSYSSVRGCFCGSATTCVIDYITMATTGNASDFGDLSDNRVTCTGAPNSIRGIIVSVGSTDTNNIIEYITIASLGNSTDFGDLTVARSGTGSVFNVTRDVFCGGEGSSSYNVIDYIIVMIEGNSTDFGDLLAKYIHLGNGCSNIYRGVIVGGNISGPSNQMSYITIDTAGNGTDFGDLTTQGDYARGCSGN